jgi:hypothetical protein
MILSTSSISGVTWPLGATTSPDFVCVHERFNVLVGIEGRQPDDLAAAARHAMHPFDGIRVDPAHRFIQDDTAPHLDALHLLHRQRRAITGSNDMILQHDAPHAFAPRDRCNFNVGQRAPEKHPGRDARAYRSLQQPDSHAEAAVETRLARPHRRTRTPEKLRSLCGRHALQMMASDDFSRCTSCEETLCLVSTCG